MSIESHLYRVDQGELTARHDLRFIGEITWLEFRIPGLKGCMQLVQLELKS